jgi:outer membrane biosynthesis protein TonB
LKQAVAPKDKDTVKPATAEDEIADLLKSVEALRVERREVKKGISAVDVKPADVKPVEARPSALSANSPPSANSPAASSTAAPSLKARMSVSYIDAIRIKLRSCWNIDPGAKGLRDMQIVIRVKLLPTGRISSLDIENSGAYSGDPWFAAAAAGARRALLTCEPYSNLPERYYDEWKEIVFTFHPDGMVK